MSSSDAVGSADDGCSTGTGTGSSRYLWRGGQDQWSGSWRRLIFPAVFQIYLVQTIIGIHQYDHGASVILGYVILGVFATCYLCALPARWSGRDHIYWVLMAATVVLFLAEIPLARQDAGPMCVYISVLAIVTGHRRALYLVAVLAAIVFVVPATVPSWHLGFDPGDALSVVLVSLAMWAFFGIIMANRELSEARAEVAGLAAENERTRIARDLHDLLGHSLTTITVKAALAHRLSETDPTRAAIEIGEVEALARQALTDVRAAVSSYRDMTLAGELATSQQVLRAAGIDGHVLSPTDVVRPELQELFGWVVREGVTNVVRHARAHQCMISLGPDSVEIVDDGQGGSAADAKRGLVGLRERVEAAGGTVEAGPIRLGGGWRLKVTVPESGAAPDAGPGASTTQPSATSTDLSRHGSAAAMP